MPRWFRLVAPAAVALLVLGTAFTRASGLNPASLWYDDLAWAVFARLHDPRAILFSPTNAPPGFLALLSVSSWLFEDPEWSMQIVPFAAGLASIPAMAAVTWRMTRSAGLAVLAAGVTALNPLLAHYTIFVKSYTLDFLVTSVLLYLTMTLLERREVRPLAFAGLIGVAAVSFPVSVTSVFVSVPAINLVAVHDWRTRRSRRPLAALSVVAVEVALAAGAVWFRRDHGGNGADYSLRDDLLAPLGHWSGISRLFRSQMRIVAERSLPSWVETQPWVPETVDFTAAFVLIGLIWVLVSPSTRRAGSLLAASLGMFAFTTYVRLYPLTTARRSICSFPIFIALAVMGVHGVTQWLPRKEAVRLAVGLLVVLFAIASPVRVAYWDVDDSRLATLLPDTVSQADAVVLSPAGTYLTAYYGPWRAGFRKTRDNSDGSGISIFRARTLQLSDGVFSTRRVVEHFLASVRPPGVAYLAFRSGNRQTTTVLQVLREFGYVPTAAETTARGTLYIARQSQDTAQ